MALGRKPDFEEENRLARDLWKRKVDGTSDILKACRLITIWAPHTTPPPDAQNGWMPHEFQYPCLIVPLVQLTPAFGTSQSGKLFANYGEPAQTPPDAPFFARHSHNGMLWIPFPGKWYIVYDGAVDTKLPCMVIDDTCGAAQHLLPKRGIIIQDSEILVTTAAAVNLLTDNQFRDGMVIQNQGTVDVWVRRGAFNGPTPAAVSTGLVVPPGEPLELVGDLAWRGALNARADGVDSPVAVWEILS